MPFCWRFIEPIIVLICISLTTVNLSISSDAYVFCLFFFFKSAYFSCSYFIGFSFIVWLCIICYWRRPWQPTPIFLPGESPWSQEPGGLQSMGLQRVGHNWVMKHVSAIVSIFAVSWPQDHYSVHILRKMLTKILKFDFIQL